MGAIQPLKFGVRLARFGEPGGMLFNGYQHLSLLAGLVSHLQQHDAEAGRREIWVKISDQLVTDVGDVYGLWSQHTEQTESLPALNRAEELHLQLARRVGRLAIADQLIHVGTPTRTIINVLQLAETGWRRLTSDMAEKAVAIGPQLQRLAESSAARLALIPEPPAARSALIDPKCFSVVVDL